MRRTFEILALTLVVSALGCDGRSGAPGGGAGSSGGAIGGSGGSAGKNGSAGNAGTAGNAGAGVSGSAGRAGSGGNSSGGNGLGGNSSGGNGSGGASGGSLGTAGATASCVTCHGSADNPAPPKDTNGDSATSVATVGAHQQHLTKANWHATVSCINCHVVPTKASWDTAVPSHMNGKHDFTPGGITGATASFDEASVTCANVYCHGSTLGNSSKPVWNKVDGSQSACGSCHAIPPSGSHPQSTACQSCHGAVVASFTAGNPPSVTWKNGDLHINGKVEMGSGSGTGGAGGSGGGGSSGSTCTACHGDPATGAINPPKGTNGETNKSDPAVGAHAEHLASSTWHRTGVCSDCHTLPTSAAHSNGKVDFTWSGPSVADGAAPSFSTTAFTCANTYCHGSTLAAAATGGKVNRTPVWNKVDGTWDACGTTCHTNPPGGTHTTSTACQNCHGTVIAAFTPGNPPSVTWKNAALHIDGKVDASSTTMACTSCHGDATRATNKEAPPKGTNGETATTDAAVGAHAQHLAVSTWHRNGACADCHSTPTSMSHANGKVDFTWGAPSNADGASPTYSTTAFTCTNTYCHGSTLAAAASGGSVKRTPVWNQVNGSWDACGSTCHTNPPGGTHAKSNQCAACHAAVISGLSGTNATWKSAALHINGKVDSNTPSCTACHGNPPNSGTHTRREHKVACTNCHPNNGSGATHLNGTVDKTCGSNQAGCHGG